MFERDTDYIVKDDKVVIMFHNRPEFLVANYGVQRAGALGTVSDRCHDYSHCSLPC